MNRLPHWLRHDWGDWGPTGPPHAELVDAYEIRLTGYDVRKCMLCGRRQIRRCC